MGKTYPPTVRPVHDAGCQSARLTDVCDVSRPDRNMQKTRVKFSVRNDNSQTVGSENSHSRLLDDPVDFF